MRTHPMRARSGETAHEGGCAVKVTWRALRLGITIGLRGRSWAHGAAVLAVGVAAMFLAIAAALPGTVTARIDRDTSRQPRCDFMAPTSAPFVLTDDRLRLVEGDPLTEFVVAPSSPASLSSVDQVSPPPGLARLPRPGEVFVSPEVAALTQEGKLPWLTHPDYPVVGLIGEEGLRNPHELVIWRGVSFDDAARPNQGGAQAQGFGSGFYPAHGFGWADSSPALSQMEEHGIDPAAQGVLLVCALVAALPCLIAGATASSVVARRRKTVLSGLISAGLSVRSGKIIATGEAAFITALGWAVGLAAAPLVAPLLNRLLPTEAQWFNQEFHVFTPVVLAVALLSVVVVGIGAFRDTKDRTPKPTGLMVWVASCLLMATVAAFSLRLREFTLFLGLAGLALAALALRPAVSYSLLGISRWVKKIGRAGFFAGARLSAEARDASRGPAAVSLAVLASALTSTMTGQLIAYQQGVGIIDELNAGRGTPIVVHTQHPHEVSSIADGAVVLATGEGGRVFGDPAQVKTLEPWNAYTQPSILDSVARTGVTHSSPPDDAAWYVLWKDTTVTSPATHATATASTASTAAANSEESATAAASPDGSSVLMEKILQADPVAVIYTEQIYRAARNYASDQVAALYRVAAWWTVITCAVFALVAAAATASHRKSLVASLGIVGVHAGVQRRTWLLYALVPLALSLALGAITAVVADVSLVTLLDIHAQLEWRGYLVPVGVSILVAVVLGGLYFLIAARAISETPQLNHLRRD